MYIQILVWNYLYFNAILYSINNDRIISTVILFFKYTQVSKSLMCFPCRKVELIKNIEYFKVSIIR